VAVAKATLEPEVTPANECFIRTYHPALSVAPVVYSFEEISGKVIWMIPIVESFRVGQTHAGNREIHIAPAAYKPDPLEHLIPRPCYGITRLIHPRRMLTAHDISTLRSFFPGSIGIRVLISGFAIFLFRNVEEMREAWNSGCPPEIGGLNVGYDVVTVVPTAVASGHDIADSAESFSPRGCIGLRIKQPNGTDALTTVTHGFVKLPSHPRIFLRMADWYMRVKDQLSKFIYRGAGTMSGEVESKGKPAGNSPLGKEVYIAGTQQKVCRKMNPST
jgi:hypothetical protein